MSRSAANASVSSEASSSSSSQHLVVVMEAGNRRPLRRQFAVFSALVFGGIFDFNLVTVPTAYPFAAGGSLPAINPASNCANCQFSPGAVPFGHHPPKQVASAVVGACMKER